MSDSDDAGALAPLPPCYLITPEPASASDADLEALLVRLDTAFAAGLRLVQLRAKTLGPAPYAALAAAAIARSRAAGARLICNGDITAGAARALGAHGIHLGQAALEAASARPVPDDLLFSAACHDQDALRHARRIGADLVTLSPVLPTLSHPGAPALGWARFADWLADRDIHGLRVYALGGMTPGDLPTARRHGAQGIAGIRGLGMA